MIEPMQSHEIQRLCQILASLNYTGQQTLVMPSSFEEPNFNLVCDILRWFAQIVGDSNTMDNHRINLSINPKQMEPNMSQLPESNRISFLISIGKLFAARLGIQLNLISLYKADKSSCHELVKLAEPIYQAAFLSLDRQATEIIEKPASEPGEGFKDGHGDLSVSRSINIINKKVAEVLELLDDESSRNYSPKIGELATDLDLLLSQEEQANEERMKAIDRRLELPGIERTLKDAHTDIVTKADQLNRANGELEKDLDKLDERLAKKEMEVLKAKERLNDLLLQSPAYLDRYNRLQKDYQAVYESYVSNYRNLTYLEWCVYSSSLDYEGGDGSKVNHISTSYLTRAANPPSESFRPKNPTRLFDSLLGGTSAEAVGPTGNEDGKFDSVTREFDRAAAMAETENGDKRGLFGSVSGEGDRTDVETEQDRKTDAGTSRRVNSKWSMLERAGGNTGLELEGLLNEFVADSGDDYVGRPADDEVASNDGVIDGDEDADGLSSDDTGTSTGELDGLMD